MSLPRNLIPEQSSAHIRGDRSGGHHQEAQARGLHEVEHGALMLWDQRRSRSGSGVCVVGEGAEKSALCSRWTNQRPWGNIRETRLARWWGETVNFHTFLGFSDLFVRAPILLDFALALIYLLSPPLARVLMCT